MLINMAKDNSRVNSYRDNSKGISQRRLRNQAKVCMYEGCSRGRHSLSGYCLKHKRNKDMWGSPIGHNVKRNEYEIEYAEVSEVIDRNSKTHSGILKAVSEIKAFLQMCSNNIKYPHDIARLEASPQITPIDILKEASAIYLLREGRPYHHPFKDDNHFMYVLGHRIIKLMPQEMVVSRSGRTYSKGTQGKAKKVMGEFLSKRLGVLLLNISRHVLKKAEREKERVKAMGEALQ